MRFALINIRNMIKQNAVLLFFDRFFTDCRSVFDMLFGRSNNGQHLFIHGKIVIAKDALMC